MCVLNDNNTKGREEEKIRKMKQDVGEEGLEEKR